LPESSLAFNHTGGAHGIAKVTLGTLPGFLIGCFDAYQSVFNAAYSIVAIALMINEITGYKRRWLPVW
jgi:hypothetical protein